MPTSLSAQSKEDEPSWRLAMAHLSQTTLTFLILSSILFISAGRLDWWEAWVFLSVYFLVSLIATLWMLRTNPELTRERDRPGPNVKRWDNLLVGINLLLTLAMFSAIGLDVRRYAWSDMPLWLRGVGLLGFVPAFGLPVWATQVNPYLSSRVRIQEEREHQVVDTGPYRYVRHPMYVGMMFYDVCVPLLLGSWWGLAVGAVMIAAVIMHTALEDGTLQRELPGYGEYSQRVRYRLFPGVW